MITSTGIPLAVTDDLGELLAVRTPCGRDVRISAGDAMAVPDVQVVLDPGHGGPQDSGAAAHDGLSEADLNLRLVETIGDQLSRRGIAWMSTRTADYASPLAVRSQMADDVGAKLMLSVHHNAPASAPSSIPGTEVFVQSDRPESARLGALVYDAATEGLKSFDVAWTRAHDAGVMAVVTPEGRDAYGILQRPETPTALIEVGYLANPAEAHLFNTPGYLTTVGSAIADALDTFLTSSDEAASGLGPARVFAPGHAAPTDSCQDPPLE